MDNILDKIVAAKRESFKNTFPEDYSPHRLNIHSRQTKDFATALKKPDKLSVISEMKKASPSAGIIRKDYDPAALAESYKIAGADCLSILTETDFFQGSAEHLKVVRDSCDLPILRKDFILDPLQVRETYEMGADAMLLIVACLDKKQIIELLSLADEFSLTVITEVHNREETETALECDAKIIGINNRNLKNLVTDIRTTENLISMIPKEKIIISESGLRTRVDLRLVEEWGADAILIGESLLRKDSPGEALYELIC